MQKTLFCEKDDFGTTFASKSKSEAQRNKFDKLSKQISLKADLG
jgi:hypothetical protein